MIKTRKNRPAVSNNLQKNTGLLDQSLQSTFFSNFIRFGKCYFHVVVCWLFSKIDFSKKIFQEHYQSVQRFGSRSGWTFCQS